MIVATRPMEPEELKRETHRLPGTMTTAYLARPSCFSPISKLWSRRSTKYIAAVRGTRRGLRASSFTRPQLTFRPGRSAPHPPTRPLGSSRAGTCRCRWAPNSAAAVARSGIKSECCRLMTESIQYALDNRAEALEYALTVRARDMDPRLAEEVLGMYVHITTRWMRATWCPGGSESCWTLGLKPGWCPSACR